MGPHTAGPSFELVSENVAVVAVRVVVEVVLVVLLGRPESLEIRHLRDDRVAPATRFALLAKDLVRDPPLQRCRSKNRRSILGANVVVLPVEYSCQALGP